MRRLRAFAGVATTDGPSSPANFIGLGTVSGMWACSAGNFAPFNTKAAAYEDNVVSWPWSNPPMTTPPTPCWPSPWAGLALADNPLLPRPEPRALRPAVLAIDGGNSKTDVALVASDGTLLASARGPGINAHEVGVDQTVLILDAVVKQAAAQDASRPGTAGWRGTRWPAWPTPTCRKRRTSTPPRYRPRAWSPTATVVNDTFAILRSGLTDEDLPHWGVAVVCGAGINCVGVAPDGRVTRFLALGTISGDWGGGYGLGLEVLWHAMRAEDGRGRDTALTGYLTSHFGVERVEEVTIGIHKGKIPDDDLTGLAPMLLRAAEKAMRWPGPWSSAGRRDLGHGHHRNAAPRPDRPGHPRRARRRRHDRDGTRC